MKELGHVKELGQATVGQAVPARTDNVEYPAPVHFKEYPVIRTSFSRRRFLKASTAAAAGASLIPHKLAFGYAANQRLGVAIVGAGGRGRWFVDTMPRIGENVVALCDTNERRAAESFAKMPDVPKFDDFRKMLAQLDRQIDAVIVATPDHTHAVATAAAIRAGKHVYCEKPLTHNVHESRVVRQLARQHGVATQMGNQGTATEAFRRAVELIRAGSIGTIREVHVWVRAPPGRGSRRWAASRHRPG